MIKVKVFAVNPFREVTYVVSDEKTREAVIIDAGVQTEIEKSRLDEYIAKNDIKPVLAINTHLHVDHILGVSYVMKKYQIPFAASAKDEIHLRGAATAARMYGMLPDMPFVSNVDIDLSDINNSEIKFGESILTVIPTPGHTVGGVSFYHAESKTLFTGDTLFKGSIGRTDLEGGDYRELMISIINNILPLGGDVTVYAGHGDHTTLAEEAQSNPFITEVLRNEVSYSL